MRTFRTLMLFVSAALLMTACKKDKDKTSKADVLTKSAWKIVKYEEKENNGPLVNTFPGFPTCSQDDQWIFKSNFSVDYTEGATACSGNTPHEVLDTTTWSFLENETKLKIEDDVFSIEQLDETTFVFSITETSGGITQYTKVTMGH